MADAVSVENSASNFPTHPEGQYVAQCVDIIDLGKRLKQYPGAPVTVRKTVALVHRTGELDPMTGEPIDLGTEFTVSMFETAGLRKFLEAWRGKSYTEEEVAPPGIKLEKLDGQYALISVEHKLSRGGRNYAVVKSIAPLPKMMEKVTFAPYRRAEFWEKRKAAYADEVAKYMTTIGSPSDYAPERPDVPEMDDGLPF